MTNIYLSQLIYTIAQLYVSLLFSFVSFFLLIVLSWSRFRCLDFVVISLISCVPVGFSLLMGFITILSTYPFLLFRFLHFFLLYTFTIYYSIHIQDLSTNAKYDVYR